MYSVRVRIGLAVCLFLWIVPVSGQRDPLAEKVKHAQDLVRAGRYEDAIVVYRGLLGDLPDNPSLLTNLGFALHMSGHSREALRQFEDALNIDPSYLEARLYLGAAYLSLAEPTKAVEALENLVQAQPDNKDAIQLLGEAFLSLKQFEEAAQHFERLCDLDPGSPKAWSGLGRSYEGLARTNFDELEKVAPESAYWLELVAESRFNQQQHAYAFFFYREALAKMPSLRGVHSALAEIYRKTGRPDWAAVEEERERQLPPLECAQPDEVPEVPGATQADGVALPSPQKQRENARNLECHFWAGRYRELVAAARGARTAESYYWRSRAYAEMAAKAFDRLGHLPHSVEVHKLKAMVFFNRRKYTEAATEWREALKLSPGNPRIQKELAVSLRRSGDLEGARQLLADLLRRVPDSVELNYLLGETLLELHKGEEAIPFLERASSAGPAVLEAQRELARAYLQAGKAEKAVSHFTAALPIDTDGSVYYQLALTYRSLGREELARELLDKFQEIRNATEARRRDDEQKVQIAPP
ncbi:MAG: tetratricopeptide repeat protein [Acidobacteria bacterium]|nr:tetratricopeptide repeat protein [Acidobacteriota bacterium]